MLIGAYHLGLSFSALNEYTPFEISLMYLFAEL